MLAHPTLEGVFIAPQVGWEPKSQALKRIAEGLNIGLDALAFVDDSPFEARTNFVKRWIRTASVEDVNERRPAIVEALEKDGFELALVNGGGTGSLKRALRPPQA